MATTYRLVGDGSHEVLVAPNEYGGTMEWGLRGTLLGGVTTTTDVGEAGEDYGGKANTEACVAAGIDETCAAGWCDSYSYGRIGAGEWWLPSCGELYKLMAANRSDIDDALNAIGGSALTNNYYWCSTQYSSDKSWNVYIRNGEKYTNYKDYACHVRAVSAF